MEIILKGRALKEDAHLKTILKELLYFKVLELKTVWKSPSRFEQKKRKYLFIGPGSEYTNWTPLPQHQLVMDTLKNGRKLLLRYFLKNLYKQLLKEMKLTKRSYLSLKGSGYAERRLLGRFGLYGLSKSGKAYRDKLEAEIFEVNRALPRLRTEDPKQLRNKLASLGSKVLLLPDLDDELIKEINLASKQSSRQFEGLNLDIMEEASELLLFDFLFELDILEVSFDGIMDGISFDAGLNGDMGGFDIDFDI